MSERRANRRRLRRCLALMAGMACLVLVGCNANSQAKTNGGYHALTIYGYNYTNQYIDQFSVNGQGGGNVFVSTPTAGGGKSSCCIGWTDGTPLPQTVTVRWSNATCKLKVTNSNGHTREVSVPLFKEEQVELSSPVPADPGYFEVHIYPDQHVEVAITQTWSDPRLKLDPARQLREFPPCPPDIK
jgi:Protein of unknown function (DUF3304)